MLKISNALKEITNSDNLFKIPKEKLNDVRADQTIVGGRIVYSRQ